MNTTPYLFQKQKKIFEAEDRKNDSLSHKYKFPSTSLRTYKQGASLIIIILTHSLNINKAILMYLMPSGDEDN